MNKYHIYQQEAKGKYSVIFKARRKKKLQFVAIKRMDKARKQKILNQAKILQELHHPNILKFFDYMQTKNHMWAVTQYCPGGDLLKLIEQDKSLPQPIVKGFAKETMSALAFSHSRGVVICDLKPATILINQYGNIKLGDFGSAQLLVDLMHNQIEKKKGTPCYMAPELFEVGSVYSFASDLWALGCIFYQLAQGNPPFVSSSLHDIATLAKTGQTPKVDFFSSDFNNLLEKLLIKQPENRITWREIYQHSWLKGQIQMHEMPREAHFQQYKKNKKKSPNIEMLRASQQFEGYDFKQVPANDRREQFIFEADRQNYEDNDFQKDGVEQQKQKEIEVTNKINPDIKMTKRPNPVSQIQDSTTINIFMQTLSSKNMLPIEEVIHHQSDNSVKPIIGNKDIEVIQSFSFNKKGLGFQYIQPEALADGIVNGQMQSQLKRILDGMVGEQKFNVLGYFQSIIQNSDIANYLFKSSFITYYMKLLKGYKQSALRAKMCQILGLLIRHATVIDPQILKYGIINGFLDALKDKSEKVKRKSMAALGELLFYGATQVDQKVNEWDLSMNLIHSLLKILKSPTEDEIVKMYCCKSIQNITAQAKEVGLKFAQIDTLMVLISSFNSTKNQGYRTSICCCLHHIIQLNSTLRQIFLDKIGVNNLIEAFKNPQTSSKSQQILLWALLIQFEKSPKSKITKALLDDQNLLHAVLSMLDVTSSVVKGRIYVFIYYQITNNLRKSTHLLESKLFYLIERQGKDGAKYETQCLQFILVTLYQNFELIVNLVEQDIKKSLKPTTTLEFVRKNYYIGIVNHMINSAIFQQLFEKYQNIESLVSLLNLFDVDCENTSFIQIKSQFMQVIQKILGNAAVTQKLQQPYCNSLLPFLVGKILKSNQNDIRFCCMKYLLYLVNTYMSEQNIYDSTILSTTTAKITTLVNDHLIPQLDFLLSQEQQEETVASMTLKLIAVLFQISKTFIKKFCQTCKFTSIIKYYCQSSSVNVLKATQLLVSSGYLNQSQLESIFPVTQKILKYYISSGQQIYLQYPLDILKKLVKYCSEQKIDSIWQIVISLQSHQDLVIREKAQDLIAQFIKLKKVSSKGKWEIKSKKALQNYEQYLKLTGRECDNTVVEHFKKPAGRYK